MTDDEFDDIIRAWSERLSECSIDALKALHALPSPGPERLEALEANAVLIDGVGGRREVWMPDFRPMWLVPIPQPLRLTMHPDMTRVPRLPVARFALSTVQEGKAVYRFIGKDDCD